MSVTTTPRRRWTDAAIEGELRAQSAELGHFPTRTELVSRGLRGLWDAMRAGEGVDAWRQRLGCGEPASHEELADAHNGRSASYEEIAHVQNGRSASHEEIAVRAYQLYEGGIPGDPVDHWLAAERELGIAAH